MLNLRKFATLKRLGAGLAAAVWTSPALAEVAPKVAAATPPAHAASEFIVIPAAFSVFMVVTWVLSRWIRGGDGVERDGAFPIPFDDDHPQHH